MDIMTSIKERRSCRDFLPDSISENEIGIILEAATWAPSPLNTQPWEFIVVTNNEIKGKIFLEANRCREWGIEASGWKWLDKYQLDFLKTVPVIVAVVGDPKKSGLDIFQEEGGVGYQHACAAAIQNMLLSAQSLNLGSLWFTMFDKKAMREILSVDSEKTPLGLVCIGKAKDKPHQTPRKDVKKKTTFIS